MTTIGEYRVGIDFNPSGDDLVGRIKRAAADLVDLIGTVPGDGERARLRALAQTATEEAAMWAVKAATKPAHVAAELPAPADDPFRIAVEKAMAGAEGRISPEDVHDAVRRGGFPFATIADVHDMIIAIGAK